MKDTINHGVGMFSKVLIFILVAMIVLGMFISNGCNRTINDIKDKLTTSTTEKKSTRNDLNSKDNIVALQKATLSNDKLNMKVIKLEAVVTRMFKDSLRAASVNNRLEREKSDLKIELVNLGSNYDELARSHAILDRAHNLSLTSLTRSEDKRLQLLSAIDTICEMNDDAMAYGDQMNLAYQKGLTLNQRLIAELKALCAPFYTKVLFWITLILGLYLSIRGAYDLRKGRKENATSAIVKKLSVRWALSRVASFLL